MILSSVLGLAAEENVVHMRQWIMFCPGLITCMFPFAVDRDEEQHV
jgi:hypothetical protein